MDCEIIRETWIDGLFRLVIVEFNKLFDERKEDHPRSPVDEIYTAAVNNVMKEPIHIETFAGTPIEDARIVARNIFALGVHAGQRLLDAGIRLKFVSHPSDLQ